MAAIYSIIQPDAFYSGLHQMELTANLQNDAILNKVLRHWPSPFTGLSIIRNLESITHRDTKAHRASFDLLATFGEYSGGRFYVPTLGLYFRYEPGTVITLAGNVLEHGACEVEGDRTCLSNFWHQKVAEALQVAEPVWLTTDILNTLLYST